MNRVLLSLLLLLSIGLSRVSAEAPAGFDQTFRDLSGLLDKEELSGFDVARATLLSAEYFGAGTQALAVTRSHFARSTTQGQAGLSGVFLVSVGGENERTAIRRQVETDATKRKWIWNYVATEQRFFAARQQGSSWQPMASVIPSSAKCRLLAESCMDSRDLLTRRAGLYWGYFVADSSYWKKVQTLAQGDADKTSRVIATRLLASRTAKK